MALTKKTESHLPPLRQATPVPVSSLSFDPENPRFTPDIDIDTRKDAEIIRELNENADLGELIQSIASSGYVDIEPLVVMENGGKLLVLEGNRRLAALKLLTNPKLAKEVDVQLPEFNPTAAKTFSTVTVYRVDERIDARDFIGFKHINGPHRWDSFAKAKFAADWFQRERPNGVTLKDIARRMGDRHDTIQRMVAGYYVLEQAEKTRQFKIGDRYPAPGPFPFSHLYTALTRPGYREFLGLPEEWRSSDPAPRPVPKDKLDNLGMVMRWLYGSKDDDLPPIVTTQNPHVKQLGEVLAMPRARSMLISQGNLRTAYAMVETPLVGFEKSLSSAHVNLETAQSKVEAFDGTDPSLMEIADSVLLKASTIKTFMDAKAREIDISQKASKKSGKK